MVINVGGNPVVQISGADILFTGPSGGYDFWVGKNVTHCYFGMDPGDASSPAPPVGTLGYFARGTGGVAHVMADAYNSSLAIGAANQLLVRRFRGTPASPSSVLSGDYLGVIGFAGYSGSQPTLSARIYAIAAENFGSTRGTKVVLSTIQTGAGSLSDRMWFEGTGQIVLGNQLLLSTGGTAAGTAPLKLQSGSLNTTPENGALEFDGTHLYFTIGSTRSQVV